MLSNYPILNRRHFLKHMAGFAAMAAPSIQFMQGLKANAQTLKKENKSLIILWMSGGPPTIDFWDLKPGTDNGGPFKPIKTAADGVEISEHMPRVAEQFKNLIALRSLTTTEGDHNRGTQLMHTGQTPSPIVAYPHIGSVMNHQLTPKEFDLPGFISVGGGMRVGPGFLGMTYAPFTVQNPGQPPENIRAPGSLGQDRELEERVRRRQRLFYTIEDNFSAAQRASQQEGTGVKDSAQDHTDIYGKAFNLLVSPRGKVFDLATESQKTLQAYGNNNFGRGCLLARKLVEAGVTCVEVDLGGWDLHNNTHQTLSTQRCPTLDPAFGQLVADLVDRGLWKNTAVVWMGEFGRTPRINQNAGRDHWSRSWSIALGGGLMKGGQAYGSTDDNGTAVKDKPVKVGDLFATLYKALGLDPKTQVRDNLGRPMPIATGNPMDVF